MEAVGFVKAAFDALKQWPLVQGSVAILVLIFAALLARGALKERLPRPPAALPPASIPIQIESPWITQQIIETHYEVEQIKERLGIISNKIDGIAILLKRRQKRQDRSDKSSN